MLGLLPVGDSLCTTNPMHGWGASMALTYAFAAVDAATALAARSAMALAYDDAVSGEAVGLQESAAMDAAAATMGARTSPSGTGRRGTPRTYHVHRPWSAARSRARWAMWPHQPPRTADTVLDDPLVVERPTQRAGHLLTTKATKPPGSPPRVARLLAAARPHAQILRQPDRPPGDGQR